MSAVVGSFNIYGSRRLVLSIYTVAGGWFFQYIREPEVGSFNINGSGSWVISIYTVTGGWSFDIYATLKLVLSIYTGDGGWFFQYIR